MARAGRWARHRRSPLRDGSSSTSRRRRARGRDRRARVVGPARGGGGRGRGRGWRGGDRVGFEICPNKRQLSTMIPSDVDVNAALRALEPASRDANGFKARSALVAMRELAMGAMRDGKDCGAGASACWSGIRNALGSQKREIRSDGVKTMCAFLEARAMTEKDAEERLGFAWMDNNWRFRVSAIEILSGACASEGGARRCFDRFAGALGDREAEVRERAMDGILMVHERFPSVVRAALEAARDDMRPQHVKELERRMNETETGGRTIASSGGNTSASASEDGAVVAAPVLGDALVPPPPEKISSERELARAMDRIGRDLNPSQDWLQRIAAMVRLEAITLGGGADVYEETYTESLGKLVEMLNAQIGDKRSAVVKQVSHLIVVLARNASTAFEKYVDQFLRALLKTTIVTIGVIAESGNACIRGVIAHCEAPRIVNILAETVVNERSPKMRRYIVEYMTLILKSWSLNERQIESIGGALQKTLSDADATVRSNSKACFEVLSVTAPAASEVLLTKVHSKVARTLSGGAMESESETRGSRGASSKGGAAPKPWQKPPQGKRPQNDIVFEVVVAEKPPPAGAQAQPKQSIFLTSPKWLCLPSESNARLKGHALDDADVRTHGASAVQFEAQVTLHASRIAELILGYISDTNALVIDPALEAVSILVYVATDELKPLMPDLCLGVFECLTDYRESTRALASEALTAIGDAHKPDALLPSLLRSLSLSETPRAKTGVLEFALYVLSGRGGGANEVSYPPAKVSPDLESWIDLVIELACDVDEAMAKAAGSNLAAIYSHVDDSVVTTRLMGSSEFKRVRFMEALERRVPKLARVLQPLLEAAQPPPPKAKTPKFKAPNDAGCDSLDDDYADQNVTLLNRMYETMKIEASPAKHRTFGERVVEALEGLRDENVDVVVRSLRDITALVMEDFEQLKPYLKLIVPAMCSTMDDRNELVAAHAFGALNAIFQNPRIDAGDAFTALSPLVSASASSDSPMYCVQTVIDHATTDAEDMDIILPSLARACESKTLAVRQRAFHALGTVQRVFGAEFVSPFVNSMASEHRELIEYYARK
ncbi:armadillo-type protein [Ostreococcus tauri]|uniref:Armadillo-type protein n=1 Tax=Ostreococcus tauri TaxID=70448 RepID=A0A1Y5IGS7_OSTTA|nr:armadillo-type protein [Ostreococcus tauri]